MYKDFIQLVRDIYQTNEFIPLHAPVFPGNEKAYLNQVIDSTYVSSVGEYVEQFEQQIAAFTGVKHAIATVNGTAALHIALLLAGVKPGEEVITQSLTFVATCNAIQYCGAEPVFVDVDRANLGLSPLALVTYLHEVAEVRDGSTWNKKTGKRIAACLPMHTFGHPVDMVKLLQVCAPYQIPVVEDAAEALGSWQKKKHCGSLGKLGVLSFNGNKIITTGGGGMILTNDPELARLAKHLTTTAKLTHPWLFNHDQVGFNYRMPNLNAALGVAQLENLLRFVSKKRQIAQRYIDWCKQNDWQCITEPKKTIANYWLNAVVLGNDFSREVFLQATNAQGVMTRPIWQPMHRLPMYKHCQRDELINTEWLAERVVNVPSGVVW